MTKYLIFQTPSGVGGVVKIDDDEEMGNVLKELADGLQSTFNYREITVDEYRNLLIRYQPSYLG